MLFYQISLIVITSFYLSIIICYTFGWDKIKTYQRGKINSSDLFISLIIPFRNEEENLPHLIHSIINQTLKRACFEIILINDNSTDHSEQVLHKIIKNIENCKIISLSGQNGKKNAIALGISKAEGSLIVLTDADCRHHPEWLETIYSMYCENRPKLIIGPVLMNSTNIFGKIQSIDFFSLIISGAGACGIQRPIMCNGANLAFEKTIYEKYSDPLKKKLASGDDVFLLHLIKKEYPDKIVFLKSHKAIAITQAEKNVKNFLLQRKRWTSKSKAYEDKDTIITAFAVFLVNLTLLAGIIGSFFSFCIFYSFVIQLLTKSIVDFRILYKPSSFFKQKKLLCYFLPAQLFNIITVPYIAFSGLWGKNYWKGNKI